ncbi:hypothetical protein CN378_10440 [Bacillus sp. AFS015802]|uniref:SGNH/GDSL hydrolase family protein n=1 Tax=Bacillus sp. AFS015802 TaxID=2033486 RepID=UPI000BFA8B37|nr:SGNH/GDSL hydrolase family protein [Bacillus sp. AFS015802]PFA67258.1 hypothetical protein CN378_10440 [Bacillus sp. AFS015802]
MRMLLLIGLMIVTLFTLVSGKIYWDDRIERVQAKGQTAHEDFNTGGDSHEEAEGKKNVDVVTLDKLNLLPKEIQSLFRLKVGQGQSVNLAIVGSASASKTEKTWSHLLERKLVDTYGASVIKITTKEIANKTSTQVISEKLLDGLAASKPDILLIEPFLLYDNTKLPMDDRLKNLSTIIEQFKSFNSDVTVMIQPSNPIYQAHYYPKEEKELEKYAYTHGYTYLDHWKAWPSGESNQLLSYLTGGGLPNDKGNEVWARYIEDYFIQKAVD